MTRLALVAILLLGGCNSYLKSLEGADDEALTETQHQWWSECVKYNPDSPNACYRRATEVTP